MASFFRRKRSLIFKLIIGIPALWFVIVIFLSFQGAEDNKPLIYERQQTHDRERKQNVQMQGGGGVFEGFQNPINKLNQIVQPFNPFVNKEPTKSNNVIDNNVGDRLLNQGNPNDLVVHEAYDVSGQFRDVGPNAAGSYTFPILFAQHFISACLSQSSV